VIEIVGLIARIAFEAVLETFPFWGSSGRRSYRDYVRALPSGSTPVPRRTWRKEERSAGRRRSKDA
jgi:hypothetical protein